jgi:hypothetical protein
VVKVFPDSLSTHRLLIKSFVALTAALVLVIEGRAIVMPYSVRCLQWDLNMMHPSWFSSMTRHRTPVSSKTARIESLYGLVIVQTNRCSRRPSVIDFFQRPIRATLNGCFVELH